MATEADGEAPHGRHDIWKQREETVFQINDQYRRFWRRGDYDLGREKGNGKEIAYFVPIMFDKANRTFNWVAAANPILEAATSGYENTSRPKYAQDALLSMIKTLRSGDKEVNLQWEKFKDRYSDQPGAFKEYIEYIHKIVERYGNENPNDTGSWLSNEQVKRFWTATLMAYSCYSHPSDKNFEGIFYRILERLGHTEPEKIADAIFGVAKDHYLDLTDWKNMRGSSFPECPLQDADGQRRMREEADEADKDGGLRYSNSRIEEVKILRSAFLDPLLMKGNWGFGEGKTFEKVTESHNFRLLVPIYDVWSGTQGWGGLKAVLVVLLKPPSGVPRIMQICGRQKWKAKIGNSAWQRNYEKMLERCGEFAQEIGQAATRRALSRPINPPYDLVRQFLRILIEVQDWEEAAVFYNNDKNPHYSFKRVTHDNPEKKYKGVREGWEEEEWKGYGADRQSPWPSNGLSVEPNEFYMWWTSEYDERCQDLWSQAVLPGLSDEERVEAGGISIRFKFPKACRIPPDPKTRQFLVEAYRRQQVELMRGLIPKVRARRAALRNAVSAIMGRNMSHNIGSHVLARYAAKIASEAMGTSKSTETENPSKETGQAVETSKPAETGVPSKIVDPAADFLGYLQKRMDFLAEVGTNDEALGVQPLSLKTHLERLNLAHEEKRLGFPPLLSFIAGSASVKANVTVTAEGDNLFSCPGGEVGVHALYVILENIIRNSARHNTGKDQIKSIEIEVKAHAPKTGLIKLHIRDLQTRLRKDGARQDAKGAAGDTWRPLSGTVLRETVDEARKARNTKREEQNGGRGGTFSEPMIECPEILPHEINYIIEHAAIIDEDGRLNPKYLGIREMQICAQYLRRFPLSNLEDVPWSDHDPDVNKRPTIRAICEQLDYESYCLTYVVYLQEAKLLATIAAGEDTNCDVKEGFAHITLSQAALNDKATPDEGAKIQELRNFAFVAYQENGDVVKWVKRHAGRLPIRRFALPTQTGPDQASLTWEKALSWFPPLPGNLTTVMECLHKTYAETHQSPTDRGKLVGLAVGCSSCLGDMPLLTFPKQAFRPISARRPYEGYLLTEWLHQTLGAGKREPVKGSFWIDHAKDETFARFLDWINRQSDACGSLFSGIAYEPCFSDSPHTEELRRLKPGQGWELMAAAFPRVVVMDERVQAQREKEHRSIELQKYWQGMQIEVPSEKDDRGNLRCDLESPDLKACTDWLQQLATDADFLVVHLTVLEKLQSAAGSSTSILKKLLDGAKIKDDAPIVIVTGRGAATLARSKLEDFGDRIRHLPVSAVLEYLVSRPSKLGLMRVLWSASQLGS